MKRKTELLWPSLLVCEIPEERIRTEGRISNEKKQVRNLSRLTMATGEGSKLIQIVTSQWSRRNGHTT